MTVQLPTLADKLRAYRKHSALKLHQVSTATGLSVSHISEIENGTNNPSLETCQKFATLYSLTLAQLFEGITIRTRDTLQAAALQRAAEAYGFQGQRNIKPLAAMLEAIQSGQAAVILISDLKKFDTREDAIIFLDRVTTTADVLAAPDGAEKDV